VIDWFFYRCGLGIVTGMLLAVTMAVTMAVIVMRVPMRFMAMLVLCSDSDVDMGSARACRSMRSRPMSVSKAIAHNKEWNQQNCYKSVHP
jgi:hypothetical protein